MHLVKSTELAVMLGITERWIHQLKKDRVIKTHPGSRLFDAEAAKQAYLAFKLRKLKVKGLL
jgi:hypothetical protein